MCTVTYLPTPKGYILSSNRDESPLRAESPVTHERIGDVNVVFPRDSKGGSWIFKDNSGRSVVVLNGAFNKHKHSPPYKKSRGLIAKAFFEAENTIDYIKGLDLMGIEPFTMIIHDGHSLIEFRWDEDIKHVSEIAKDEPHIWSSSTLYDQEYQQLRADWFFNNLPLDKEYNLKLAQYIHQSGDVGEPTQNYVMNRENVVKTVSISHIKVNRGKSSLYYNPLV